MNEKKLISHSPCKGLTVQHGEDGHWLCFESNGKHAMLNIENKFPSGSIAHSAIMAWVEETLKGKCDPVKLIHPGDDHGVTEVNVLVNTLIMTVGLPQSGKTTMAKTKPYPIVNPDSIRLALHGQPFIGLAEPFVWVIAKLMVRALFLAGHNTVILDATNTTKKRRDEWISQSWRRKFYEFGGPEMRDECFDRARKLDGMDIDHKAGLVEAIERMANQWEPVSDEERSM